MNIAHLKAKILDLAVRGKLTEQRPEEGSAEELLERIREEKQRLIAEGKLKKEKPLPEITEDEIPFNIPAGWKWVRLGEICDINPKNNIEKNIDVSFVPMACINPGFSKDFTYEIRQWDSVKSGFTVFADNDVGIAKITPCFENRKSVLFKNLVNGFGAGTTELHILRPAHNILLDTFLFWFVKTERFIKNGIACFSGAVGQQRIGRDYVANALFPLPPLAEQKRIVEKIEAIFEQADIIEENRLALKTAVRHTKSRGLDLAVRGKLTEQRPEEGSAEELLERIREEKQRLIAGGKIKKEKSLPEITEEDIPFAIPAGWKWVTGKEIFYPMSSCKPQGESFRYIDIESIDNKKHKIKNARTILSTHAPSRASRFIEEGNVLFSLVRPYLQNIAYVDKEFSDCIASTGFFVCKAKPIIYPKYMYFLMLSKYVIDGLNSFMKGDNSPSINCDNISGFLFPLPPFAEQKRIVEKIEQIFDILDIIEKAVEE